MKPFPHPNDIRVRLADMTVPCQTTSPMLNAFLTELVIRDVKNWVFFDPLLQLIESLLLTISLCCRDSDL
jgi:hypothetical protein